MGRQHRWLLYAQACSFALIAYSIARFATADTRLLLFLFPMSLYAVTLLVSLASSSRRKRIDRIDHEHIVAAWARNTFARTAPSVDVFLPSAGEPLEILRNTYSHVAALDYPGVRVWVLDDSARPDVELLAHEFGFEYRTRPDRGHLKKAGNLRYGYDQSDGDLILILDADFVPRPDLLRELAPYFDDASVGIVQSPQFFDTDKSLGWLQRCAGATQELFYRFIQPSRDRAGAAICVGTCAIYRRAALARSGGFAEIGHSEDVHTGVKMMKAGFQVRYVPIILAKGLCPDTAAGFLNQQYRWCTGSMSLLADKTFHNAQHIRLRQRICFWAGFLYYISTALNAFIAPLPGLAMLYFLPKWVEPMNSVWLLGALALWFLLLPAVMKGRWRVDVLRVQVLYSFAHAVAISHILTGRTKEWVATGAANTRTTPLSVTIGRVTKGYIGLAYALLWGGLIHGALTYGFQRFWAMIALACLATWIHAPLLLLRTGKVTTASPTTSPDQTTLPITTAPPPRSRDVTTSPRRMARLAAEQAEQAVRQAFTGDAPEPSVPKPVRPQAPGLRRFRPDIQGLRAIAVLLVVLYHAGVPGLPGGYVGVDVFFVISGFLITGQLLREVETKGRVHFGAFYANRMRRLIPPAALVLVLTVVVARIFGSLFQFKAIATHVIYTAFYAINYRLAIEGIDYQNANGPESPLQHFWSLAVEEQFYFIWPILIAGCALAGPTRRLRMLTTVLIGLVALSLWFSVTVTASNAPLAYFALHTRAWELGTGALIALAATRLARQPSWCSILSSWSGVALVVGTGLAYTADTPFPGSAAILPVLGAGLVIAGGCRQTRGSAETFLNRRPMQGIGAVSYSWYLWHWPMLILVPFMFGRGFSWTDNLQLMVIALWIATLSYWVIESPSRRTKLRKLVWAGAGLGMSGLAALTAGVLIITLPALIGQGAAAVAVSLNGDAVAQVQKAVGQATQVKKVPRNLTPSLAQAKGDQPITSKNGCHLDYPKTVQPDCVYGDRSASATRTAVLVGDSHAQQWLPGLDKSARDNHWKLIAWTKAACSLADVRLHNEILGREFKECDEWRTAVIQRINLLAPDMVIVSQSNTVPGTSVTNTEWADKTLTSLAKFQKVKIPVVYIGDTPYHQENVPDCVAKNLDDAGACTIKRQFMAPYNGRAKLLAESLAAANVTVIDPDDWFCTKNDCPAVVGNLLVYRDESHISTAYSYYLAPLFSGLFRQQK